MKRILTIALFSIFLAGCGGGSENRFNSGSTGSGAGTTINLAGDWQISGTSTKTGDVFTGSGNIEQTGNSVSGQVSLTGSLCATAGPLSGSISGTTVQLILQEGTQALSLTGTANSAGTSITGTYTAPSGGCLKGDTGTWTATKS